MLRLRGRQRNFTTNLWIKRDIPDRIYRSGIFVSDKEKKMHISEGVLSGPVLITGAVLAVTGTVIGLKKLNSEQIPKAGVLSAAFFVASLVHVPIGPSSVHLILNGLLGLMLGWVAFPAIMLALVLQAVLFQFGGITTLGVNTLNSALPAVICYFLFRHFILKTSATAALTSFACGFLAVFLSTLGVACSLVFAEGHFFKIAIMVISAHLPVMVIEGIITAFCIVFIKKVQPEILMAET